MNMKTANAKLMEITPDIAEVFLRTSVGNRGIRKSHVDRLAGAMSRGEWRITSQCIGFDINGALRDGHHRLNAVIKSGTTISCMVVSDMPVDAYQVTDTGLSRSYADRSGINAKIMEVLRLGCEYALNTKKPTIAQIMPLIEGDFIRTTENVFNSARTNRRYFSSAPFRLAAVISIMDGGDREYIFSQYHALVALEYEGMSKISQMLMRQVDLGKANTTNKRTVLARGMKVFDIKNRDFSKMYITDSDITDAVAKTSRVILQSAKKNKELL